MTHFLDDLQQQLVAASRRLAPTPRTARWWRSARRGTPLLIAVLLVAGTAVAATTHVLGDRNDGLRVIDRLAKIPEGEDHRWVRANGLDPARAGLAFTTPQGLRVDVISDAQRPVSARGVEKGALRSGIVSGCQPRRRQTAFRSCVRGC